jgi:hypothetical protein
VDEPSSRTGPSRGSFDDELHFVLRMLAQERLSIDDAELGRTTFLSHLGAQARLVPGPWIGHRDLLYALALANLSQAQRTSLARAVLVEHGREFGVGRLKLMPLSSGLPHGGSSVRLEHRRGGPVTLYTWALGAEPTPAPCDWLALRAQPQWALDDPPGVISTSGLELLGALGGEVLVLVNTAVAAVQVARHCGGRIPLAAHPRFAPYIEGTGPDAPVLLWPQDALDGAGLRRHEVMAVVMVDAPESTRQEVETWLEGFGTRADRIQRSPAACPGRAGRRQLEGFWRACGSPRVLVTGDPAWARSGARWLRSVGAEVHVHGEATQLELL